MIATPNRFFSVILLCEDCVIHFPPATLHTLILGGCCWFSQEFLSSFEIFGLSAALNPLQLR